ncbi:hypothetical protein Pgin03_01547 [Porphyromonas gingivalis]
MIPYIVVQVWSSDLLEGLANQMSLAYSTFTIQPTQPRIILLHELDKLRHKAFSPETRSVRRTNIFRTGTVLSHFLD